MAQSKNPANFPKPLPPVLTVSRARAEERISTQISKGEVLQGKISGTGLVQEDVTRWRDIVTEMLRHIFDNQEHSDNFTNAANHVLFAGMNAFGGTGSRIQPDYASILNTYLENLRTLRDKLEFIPESPLVSSQPKQDTSVLSTPQLSEEPIEQNAWKLLGLIIKDTTTDDLRGSDLQDLSGLSEREVRFALEWLKEEDAIDLAWIVGDGSQTPVVTLKSRGEIMYRQKQAGQAVERPAVKKDTMNGKTLIIHGHDEPNLLKLKDFLLNKLGLPEPVIMFQKTTPGATLPEKFERVSQDIQFAVALMTPDDEGKA